MATQKLFRLLPLAAAVGCLSAQAETGSAPVDVYNLSLAELGQVQISIATGNSTPLDKAPATASVVYAAEIEAMGARTLDDVLKSIPGLHVSPSSLSRLDSVYSIRGIHTGFNSQVLLLINGIAVQSTLQGGHPTMFRIPAANIERVEVMRGPGSAIYGADAYAGVINVITRDASSLDTTKIAGSVGSFGSRELSVQTATEWNGIAVALDTAYQETDGDDSRRISSDFQSSLDKALKTNASLAPGALSTRYQIFDTHLALSGERWQVNLWNWLSTDAGVGAGAAQALDYQGHDDNHLVMADATYHFSNSGQSWDNSVRLSDLYSDHTTSFNIFPAGAKVPIGSDGNINFAKPAGVVSFPDGLKGMPGQVTNDSQVEFISIYQGLQGHRLRMSLGARYQTYNGSENKNFGPGVIDGKQPVVDGHLVGVDDTPYIFLEDRNRAVRFLSLQDEWQLLADLALTAGLRYDDYSDFGGTTNPRLALVWGASENLTAKLLYGSAFRAPSFNEQFQKNNPVSLGNPNLNPEQIDTLELAFSYRLNENLQANLTLFDYTAKDMIEFLADANGVTKTSQNARDQDGEGYELELSWRPMPQLRLGTSYSKQDATDAATHKPIADAPGQQIKFNADWEFAHNWFINTQLDHVADRARALGDTRKPVADYTWVNLTLRAKDLAPHVDLSLAVRNATDANAREPSTTRIPEDYPMESRSGWVELVYSF
jgi:iron complex outermembrane receptor protein